ncbi:DUF3800 domain-containing protein [Sphingomonas sp. TX0543]|uniref:DUF3800 domain-containing protein n=1 Tax=Sphingomonas sp. TX0543 TaxID=3399682 RepID=UPI003AFA461E
MQMLFIDESGTPPPVDKVAGSPLFVLGGIIIPDRFWHQVKADLDLAKRDFGVGGEIKWRFFAPHHKKAHSISHLDGAHKETLRSRLFAIIRKYKSIKTMAVIVDSEAAYRLPYITGPDDLYWYAYKSMTERFQYYLQDITRIAGQPINGIIVCDHRGPDDDRRLQELHARLPEGHHDAHSNYKNLVEGLFIAPSHLSVGVQFADMVAGAVLRSRKSADNRFLAQIETTLRKSEAGQIQGYGLIDFPKRGG